MDQNVKQPWEEFLNPEVTRPHLIAASLYIAGFEALKDSIIGRIRSFFWTGFDQGGEKIDPEYETDVLSRNRSPVYASLDWLQEHKAIDEDDLQIFDNVKRCRNTLAHELLSIIGSSGLPDEFDQSFEDMVALLRKVEVWWIVNFEIPINNDHDGTEKVNEDAIVPGPIVSMQVLMDIALGDEERSKFYYEEFRKRAGGGAYGGVAWG